MEASHEARPTVSQDPCLARRGNSYAHVKIGGHAEDVVATINRMARA